MNKKLYKSNNKKHYQDSRLTSYLKESKEYFKESKNNTIYSDIIRFSFCISYAFIFYAVFIKIQSLEFLENFIKILYLFTLILSYLISKCTTHKETVRLLSITLLSIYVLSPLLQKLTPEISTDTIYLNYIISMFINCIDTVRYAILSSEIQVDRFKINKNVPLKLEETIHIKSKKRPVNVIGANTATYGSILLCSRLKNIYQVNFLLTFSFFWFVLSVNLRERYLFHKKYILIILFHTVTSVIFFLISMELLYIFIALQIFVSLSAFTTVYILNKNIRED
ncbi:putative phosphatidylinositol N-acetylglucosaminyltransferase [Hamiltosporidium tvaerminnensis]|uniref:Putative phosphatidylinositol N-acetylglucosaminyltransferase n=1 Tax=Hamiltosporidium tvaerminnensis TaxID=1176355 RepID=A0A4Q9L8M1_9MICR|nr:putative phosphatidylinositol N-acetylglucosaminyltransferase [Hamiltosporidium tvaerminnensis]